MYRLSLVLGINIWETENIKILLFKLLLRLVVEKSAFNCQGQPNQNWDYTVIAISVSIVFCEALFYLQSQLICAVGGVAGKKFVKH